MAEEKKLGLFALIALVIGSMIGGGAFNLASDMASGAGAGADFNRLDHHRSRHDCPGILFPKLDDEKA